MSSEQVICQTKGPVSWMTLNRPEVLNAFSTQLGKQALEALRRALADDRTRVVVLTGKGRAFSVGADVNEPGADPDPAKRIDIMATIAHKAIAEIRQADKPVIAAINQLAAGYGTALALACDIRVATETLRLHYAYSLIGLTGDGGINYFLPKMVGISRALEIALTGEPICEEEAKRTGMVSRFFSEETFLEETQALAEEIAAVPPKAAAAIKAMMYASQNADLLTHLTIEKAFLTERAGAPEFLDLIRKFRK
jgi:2-(1,2-epoxy-1,2-dihydrophenyl)acetyl-CoA isomerase